MVKASLEQLRQADREERHAWRLVDAELRTKLVDFDEFSGHRFEDITGGERPPAAEEVETWTNNPLSQNSPLRNSCGGRRGTGEDTCVSGHQTEPPGEGKRTRPGEYPTHSISTHPFERDLD